VPFDWALSSLCAQKLIRLAGSLPADPYFLVLAMPHLRRYWFAKPLTPELLAAYQSPPTELVIGGDGAWLTPAEARKAKGAFVVITPDNPASTLLTEEQNSARRSRFLRQIKKRGIESTPTRARNLEGIWPDELGLALWGLAPSAAQSIARHWGQFAFYRVDEKGVSVVVTERLRLFSRG
jgi:hypothetical protein